MGNSAGKEQRGTALRLPVSQEPPTSPRDTTHDQSGLNLLPSDSLRQSPTQDHDSRHVRNDFLSSLRLGSSNLGTQNAGHEWRKETRQERDARRLLREQAARQKERQRSTREEHVDGGYLVTLGVYTGTEDYNKSIVRHLMVARRLAPFWRGLESHNETWTEHQLVAVARGLPIPSANEIPPESLSSETKTTDPAVLMQLEPGKSSPLEAEEAVLVSSKSHEVSSTSHPTHRTISETQPNTVSVLRSMIRTPNITAVATKKSTPGLLSTEYKLPIQPLVNGLHLEAQLYKDVTECPICFLYYPPFLNKTRCCDQLICSECFVQIKRPDPHAPEHADQSPPASSDQDNKEVDEGLLSEPATCPFCKLPEFGIIYEAPSFRRGLVHADATQPLATSRSPCNEPDTHHRSAFGTCDIVSSRRRTTSLSANSPMVISTDQIRPDWAEKLANARAHAARRSAAATALHTAAYMMGNRSQEPSLRDLGFGRRGPPRRISGVDSGHDTVPVSQLSMLALLTDRNAMRAQVGGIRTDSNLDTRNSPRNRVDELEEMMMMEAIRLSIASEEDRAKKDAKETKKDLKKKEKEQKKVEKAARRVVPIIKNARASASTPSLGRNPSVGQELLGYAEQANLSGSRSQHSASIGQQSPPLECTKVIPTVDSILPSAITEQVVTNEGRHHSKEPLATPQLLPTAKTSFETEDAGREGNNAGNRDTSIRRADVEVANTTLYAGETTEKTTGAAVAGGAYNSDSPAAIVAMESSHKDTLLGLLDSSNLETRDNYCTEPQATKLGNE